MKDTGNHHLEALGKSKSKMAEDHPNLQDWEIVDHTGQKIGTVYDLLYDKEAKKVRYIITNLHGGEILQQNRLVLMPVGRARYRESEQEVVFPNVTRDQLAALPDFLTVDHLTQKDEYAVQNAFRSEEERVISTGDKDREAFYDHADFDEASFYNRSGTARVETVTDTTTKEAGKVKTDGGTDALPTGTAETQTASGENKKKDEDVNVHPSPAERSTDSTDRGTDALPTGTAKTQTPSGENKKKDEDVNVHPSPAERSTDSSGTANSVERERPVTETNEKNRGNIKRDNDRS